MNLLVYAYEATKAKSVRRIFWFWFSANLVFLAGLFYGKFKIVSAYQLQIATMREQIAGTNMVCQTLASNKSALVSALSATNSYYATYMEGYTNAFLTSWRHNWYATIGKKLLFEGQYGESVFYFQMCAREDYKLHANNKYADHWTIFRLAGQVLTNYTPVAKAEMLNYLSGEITKLKSQNKPTDLGKLQGYIGEIQTIMLPDMIKELGRYADEIADYRRTNNSAIIP